MLIVVLTFASSATYVWLVMVNMAALLLHRELLPYRNSADNRTEAITLTALTLQTIVLTAYPDTRQRPSGASGLLWTLFVLPCALLVGQPLWQLVRRWRQRGRARTVETVDGEVNSAHVLKYVGGIVISTCRYLCPLR